MKLARVSVDLAKQVFQVHGVDRAERPVWCQRLKRGRWIRELERNAPAWLEDATNGLSARFRALLAALYRDLQWLDERIHELDVQIASIVRENEAVRRIEQLRGIGPLTASALVAMVGDGRQFKNGRQFAAWVGLTPKQRSSGGKTMLGGITKHGDTYLRMMFVQGAHALMRFADRRTDRQGLWLKQLRQRRHRNVAVIALANKIARIAWAVLARRDAYRAC